MNILVIDVGTSSMRGILFSEKGVELSKIKKVYLPDYLENEKVEQNVSEWSKSLYSIIKETVIQAEVNNWEIDAISLTSQRSSLIPVDNKFKPLRSAIMWQDRRTMGICKELEPYNEKIFSTTGAFINPVFSGTKMTWVRKFQQDLYEKTTRFMTPSEYMIYLLTESECIDDTYGSRTLLMNLKTKQWDEQMLSLFEVEKDKLAKIVKPGSICGYTTESVSKLTGIKKDIPVISAGGDQQCGAVGQGIISEGTVSVTLGTGGFLLAVTNKLPEKLDRTVVCNTSSLSNQYVIEYNILTCCSAFDWFCRNFYLDYTYEDLMAEVEKTKPGANGCTVLPFFQGRTTPDWNYEAKAVFADITLNTTRGDMLRALLESICYEIKNGLEMIQVHTKVSDIYVNGGLTNCLPFNQILADVLGKTIIKKDYTEATAHGALIVALTGLGIFEDTETAFEKTMAENSCTNYKPDLNSERIYDSGKERMNQVYDQIYLKTKK